MKKFFTRSILVVGGLLTLNSCSDFQEINTNPNAATSVSSQMLATNLILNITSVSYLDPALLSKAINHTEFPNSLQYNNLGKQDFSGLVVLTNVEKMISLAPDAGLKNSFTGLGKFVRAWRFFELTMRLGTFLTKTLYRENQASLIQYIPHKKRYFWVSLKSWKKLIRHFRKELHLQAIQFTMVM